MTEFEPNETMLQNYIQNKLSPNDTEQLELWLADHPEVMQDLEMDVMFSQADYQSTSQPQETKKPSKIDWKSWFNLPSVLIGALAASLVIIPMLKTYKDNPSNQIFVQNEFVITTTRSVDKTTEITTSSRFITIKIPIEDEWLKDHDEFTVLLKNSDGNDQSLNVYLNWDNELPISLQLHSLENQIIEMSVFPKDKVGETELVKHIINIKTKSIENK